MQPLHTALASLARWPRFFVWRLTDWNGKKFENKYPWNGADRFDAKAACLNNQLLAFETATQLLQQLRASASAGVCYSLGWYVMPDAGYWFLDLDGDVQWPGGVAMSPAGPFVASQGVMPVLSPTAQDAMQRVPAGCFGEYSSSMQGLHFLGRGALPDHKVKGQGMPASVELYSRERGICFGLSGYAWGNADVEGLPPFIVERSKADAAIGGTGERMPEWRGPEDDDALLEIMLGRKDHAQRLMGKATIRDLWEGDISKYAGASEADGALASHLAWWTGCDKARMMRLMWRSGLVRDKWSDPHHRTYVEITVDSAIRELLSRGQRSCYVQRELQLPTIAPAVAVTASEAPPPTSEWLRDAAEYRGVPGAMALITKAGNSDELKAVGQRIAQMQSWDAADIETLSQKLRRKSKELIGDGWTIAICRGMVTGKAVGAGEVGEVGAPDWLHEWAFVGNQNKYCHIPANFSLLTKEGTNVMLWPKPEIPFKASGDKEDAVRMLNMWGVTLVNDLGYNPRAGLVYHDHGQAFLNKFHNSMPEPEHDWCRESVEIYRQHVWNVANHDVDNFNWLMRWMAHVVQRPGNLIRWAVLLIGSKGTGKTFLTIPLQEALGPRNVKIGSAASVNNGGGFMDWVAREHALGIISDFSISGPNKFQTNEAVKPVISDDLVSITLKGKADITYKNFASYVLSTNVREPVILSENDRRWFVLNTTWLDALVLNTDAAQSYFARLEKAIKTLTPGQWLGWFQSLPLMDEMPARAPVTAAARSIVSNGVSESKQALVECVEGWDVVTSNKLSDCLRGIDNAPVGKAIMRVMNEMGFDYYSAKRMAVHGKKVGVYVRSAKVNADTVAWDWVQGEAMRFNLAKDAELFSVPKVSDPKA